MKLTLEQKIKISETILDVLIMDSKIQDKLYGEPIIITIEGMPVPVTLFHNMKETIVCLSKQSKLLGLYIPTNNRLNALKFVLRAIYKKETIERYKDSWENIMRKYFEMS